MSYPLPNGTSAVNGSNGRTSYGYASPLESTSSGLAEHPAENGAYEQTSYPCSHNEEIVNHLYQAGFQMGNYADTILHVHGRQYRLHAIILSRSPYLAHLMSTSPTNTSTRNIYVSIEDEPEVTEEGFAVALGYLYSSVSLEMLRTSNARAVLAAACFLGGLHDLCAYAYETCKSSIALDSIDEWLRFMETIPPPVEEGGPSDVPPSVFGPYAARLRADVFQFLVVQLPQNLQAFPPPDAAQAHAASNGHVSGLDSLLHVYARVPFDIFKHAVESPEFPIGSDQARFQFAKAAVAMRKSGVGRGAEETVVLAFGGTMSSGSAVHVTRKVKKRPLWKVTK